MSGWGVRDADDANDGGRKAKADASEFAATPPHGDDRAQLQRQGADVAHTTTGPVAAPLATTPGGRSGVVARPTYNQQLTYESRAATTPVAPTHGPDSRPQVPMTLPPALVALTMNPMVIANRLRMFMAAAQYAEIQAAAADRARVQVLVCKVFEQITAQVNASANGGAKAALMAAAAQPATAVDNYYKAATLLKHQGTGGSAATRLTPVATTVAATSKAHDPIASKATPSPSLVYQAASPEAPSMLAVAPAPRFDQLPMVMPPSMLAIAPTAVAPTAKPAHATQVDPVRDAADDARVDGKLQVVVAQYAEIHRSGIARAVATMLDDNRHGWPQPSANLGWQDQAHFSRVLGNLIVAQVQAEDVAALVAPYSLTTAYAQYVAPLRQAAKVAAPAFCGAVALLLQRVIFASVQRLGGRVESLLADGVALRAGGVVTSHPVDASVVTAMTIPAVLDTHRVTAAAGRGTPVSAARTNSATGVAALRTVKVHWLGRTDATLWNYLRTEPADASCEEVAIAIAGGQRGASAQAYQITAHGDRFQVAPTLARAAIAAHFAGAFAGAVRNDAFAAQPGAALAASPQGDGAALAQAGALGTPQASQAKPRGGQAITLQGVLNVQRDIGAQLHAIHGALAPLALASLIAPAEAFRARNVAALTDGDISVWTQWLPVLNAQHLLLIEITRRVVPAAQQALRLDITARLTRQSPANARAVKALVKVYARAAGASHLPLSSQEILAELTQAQATAQLDEIDHSQLDLQNATAGGADRTQAGATHEAQAKLDAARTHALRGDVDRGEIDEAQIAAREPALRRRMAATEQALAKLQATVAAKRGFLSTQEFYHLPIALEAAQLRLHRIEGIWQENTRLNGRAGAALSGAEKWQARAAGVAAAEHAFAQIGGNETLAGLLQRGAKLVDHQYRELAEGCAKLAVMLMITVVTAGIAAEIAGAAELAMLARAQRAMAFAGEIAGLTPEATAIVASTVARGVGAGTSLVVDTAINTGVQAVTQGGDLKRSALDNLIMSGFNRLFAGPMAALQATEIEAAAMSRLGRAKLFVTGVTAEALAGMMQGELTRLTTATMGLQNAHSGGFSDELLQQGAGIALGKHFHRMRQRWTQHAARIDAVYREQAEWLQLKAAREAFFAQADALAMNLSPDPAAGARLLAKNVALAEQEMALKRRVDARGGDVQEAGSGRESAPIKAERTGGENGSQVTAPAKAVANPHANDASNVESKIAARKQLPEKNGFDPVAVGKQMAEVNHAQTDLHSHFMGNVPPEKFAAELVASGQAPKLATDVSGWEPLLREVAAISDPGLVHQHEQNGGQKTITQRGGAGDAVELAKKTLDRIEELKKQLAGARVGEEVRERLKKQIDDLAKSAIDKSLRASDETDFNSSYEVRDVLLKKFYGAEERKSFAVTEKSIVAARSELEAHFVGRPVMQARIGEAAALEARGEALTAAEKQGFVELRRQIDEQFAYDQYTIDTLVRLAQDNITYTEQSNSVNKLLTRFDEGQIQWAKVRAKAAHPTLAKQLDALEVKHLAMITTNHLGARDANTADAKPGKSGMSSDADFNKARKAVGGLLARSDVVGMDVAGIEHHRFSTEGKERFIKIYDDLASHALQRGEPIVMRPHVGEGGIDTTTGAPYARDANRQTAPDGELTHYARARANLDALIDCLQRVANRPENSGKLPPEVVVRFGHATHATPAQAAHLTALGIVVEVNLGSNRVTGALAANKPSAGKADTARGPDTTSEPFDVTKYNVATFEDHALATLIFCETKVVLSTDGHEVMATSMKAEFEAAAKVIADVKRGEMKIRISVTQAQAMNEAGGTVSIPAGAVDEMTIEVGYAQLSSAKRKLYETAYQKFFEAANEYVANRPKSGKVDSKGARS